MSLEQAIERIVRRVLAETADKLNAETMRLAQQNATNAESRRFKRGPFNLTEDEQRRATMRVLDVVAKAMKP